MQDLSQSVTMLKNHGMPKLNCHGENIFARRIPELVAWSSKIRMEASEQTRSHVRSRSVQPSLKPKRGPRPAAAKKAAKTRALRSRKAVGRKSRG
jgi:hypothetical protein